MREGSRRPNRNSLRKCWNCWTAVIALFAQRHPARRRVDPRAYAALRRELMAVCRSLAEANLRHRAYYTGLEEMVRPWLNLRVLARTDRGLLGTLLQRCREVEYELNGRRWRLELPRSVRRAMVILSGGAIALGLVSVLTVIGFPVIATLRDVSDSIWFAIKYATGVQKLAAVAVTIVVVSIYTVSRSARA